MTDYICFNCGKKIPESSVRRRIRCPYCGSKIILKERVVPTKVKAR